MKEPKGLRARNLGPFIAEVARKKAVVAAIWGQDQMPHCKLCKRLVMKNATDPAYAGYIHWRNPVVIQVDGAYLVCGKHFKPQVVNG